MSDHINRYFIARQVPGQGHVVDHDRFFLKKPLAEAEAAKAGPKAIVILKRIPRKKARAATA